MLALSFLAPVPAVAAASCRSLLLAAYVVSQLRRRGYVVRFTTMDLLDSVAPKRPRWRRHLPAIGLLLGLVALSLSLAKPAVAQQVADKRARRRARHGHVAVDGGHRRGARPRLAAAQDAARTFLKNVPDGVRVGLVGFDNGARLLVPPTDKTAVVERGIDRLQLGEGTAIGEAVFTSLDAIDEALQADPGRRARRRRSDRRPTSATPGEKPAVVVLLSDGENTVGRSNDEAAAAAAAEGRPVYTVAVGTDGGTDHAARRHHASPCRSTARRWPTWPSKTGARSFTAYSSDELRQVYEDLGRTLTKEPVQKDVSGWFVGGAMGLLALAALGSLLWFARLP